MSSPIPSIGSGEKKSFALVLEAQCANARSPRWFGETEIKPQGGKDNYGNEDERLI
ncbi:hypothetical protein F2Q69_00038921 [Brassica cretica]|uniref:Uncharacterized protein n=1 Tax=Brassica cretica TaxID=69181 RepID=A0A8S9SR55_BRACR|nr:hypothetical protein F2Q69_00038921 [Brassica cretica]